MTRNFASPEPATSWGWKAGNQWNSMPPGFCFAARCLRRNLKIRLWQFDAKVFGRSASRVGKGRGGVEEVGPGAREGVGLLEGAERPGENDISAELGDGGE